MGKAAGVSDSACQEEDEGAGEDIKDDWLTQPINLACMIRTQVVVHDISLSKWATQSIPYQLANENCMYSVGSLHMSVFAKHGSQILAATGRKVCAVQNRPIFLTRMRRTYHLYMYITQISSTPAACHQSHPPLVERLAAIDESNEALSSSC